MKKDKLDRVVGYKAFNDDHTNRYGLYFEEGMTYTSEGKVSFGVNSTGGFHMCKNLEDTLRYFIGLENDPVVAEVEGSGDIVEYEDDYNGYYDMYSVERLEVKRFLSREEMLYTILDDTHIYDERVCRFVQGIRMNPVEIELFKEYFEDSPRVLQAIAYYQEGDTEVYNRGLKLKK
ncbi:MAG: hypothetical protein Q4E69_06170 [Bacilli bacterium]|nr:hypothetical protein [Bacilli bacterium]